MAPPVTPLWSKIRNDPAGLQHCFLGEGEVFVVTSAFKSVTLKVDMVTSIFSTFLSKIVGGSKKIVFYFLGFLSLVKLKEDATLERQGAQETMKKCYLYIRLNNDLPL